MQADLADIAMTYDGVGNPTSITDSSVSTWPAGAKPASSRAFTYDAAYHLKQVDVQYAGDSGQDDSFMSPYAAEEAHRGTLYPGAAATPKRVRQQTFTYDWLGNMASSDDDAHVFPDRSLGVIKNGGANGVGPQQLTSAASGGASLSAVYDAAGNLAHLSVQHAAPCTGPCTVEYLYQWDEVGMLKSAQRGTIGEAGGGLITEVSTAYAYDADDNRVLRSTYQPSANFRIHTLTSYAVTVFDSLRLVGAQLDGNGDYVHNAMTEEVSLNASNGERFGRAVYTEEVLPSVSSGQVHVFMEIGDHIGSTSFLIDHDTSELVERPTYLGYGATESDYRPDRWGDQRAPV